MDTIKAAVLEMWSSSCVALSLYFLHNDDESLVSKKIVSHKKINSLSSIKTLSRSSAILLSMEEENSVGLILNLDLQLKDVLGIQWGPWYIKPRSLHWWDFYRQQIMDDDNERFQKLFRVSVRTFNYLCDMVRVDMEKKTPISFHGIRGWKLEVDKQVAMSLHRLATGDPLLSILEMFGVSPATVSKSVKNFILAMLLRGKHHLQWPTPENLEIVKRKFEHVWGIPQACGAIDCTHVEIELPKNAQSTDFYDKDHDYSYVVQAIVDSEMQFLDIFAGFPGVVHDDRVLKNSGFYKAVEEGQLLNGPKRQIQGIWIPELIIGDAGYTQSEWMLVPLPGRNLHGLHESYNHKHSSTRIIVERAFGRLKGVWRILYKPMWSPNEAMVPKLIYVCCILHNILLEFNDTIDEDVPLSGHHDEGRRQQISRHVITNEAEIIREAIIQHLHVVEVRTGRRYYVPRRENF